MSLPLDGMRWIDKVKTGIAASTRPLVPGPGEARTSVFLVRSQQDDQQAPNTVEASETAGSRLGPVVMSRE